MAVHIHLDDMVQKLEQEHIASMVTYLQAQHIVIRYNDDLYIAFSLTTKGIYVGTLKTGYPAYKL
jgi:hypothetical protein